MKKNNIKHFVFCFFFFVIGCASSNLKSNYIEYSPEIIKSLDLEKDGFVGKFGTNENNSFTINKTMFNDNKLCRVVTLDYQKRSNRTRKIETYCKAKGGSWH